MKGLRRIGWFGWSLITIMTVVLVGSTLFFFNIFGLNFSSILQKDEQAVDPSAKETVEVVENIQETVGKDHQEVGSFIAQNHKFYNQTTGYGAINSLDWDDQRMKAEEIIEKIDDFLTMVEHDALTDDLKHIKKLAKQVLENEEASIIRDLHRMFHDLDIALNSYDGYDKIWNVTETLKFQ